MNYAQDMKNCIIKTRQILTHNLIYQKEPDTGPYQCQIQGRGVGGGGGGGGVLVFFNKKKFKK